MLIAVQHSYILFVVDVLRTVSAIAAWRIQSTLFVVRLAAPPPRYGKDTYSCMPPAEVDKLLLLELSRSHTCYLGGRFSGGGGRRYTRPLSALPLMNRDVQHQAPRCK